MTVNVASVGVLTDYLSKTDTKHLDVRRPIQKPSARYYQPETEEGLAEGRHTSLVRQGGFQEADSGKGRYCLGIPQY